jgi:hypothetical protein
MPIKIASSWAGACLLCAALASMPSTSHAAESDPAPVGGLAVSDSGGIRLRSGAALSPYREHAPLAFFSLGSLAIGGIFYGIQSGMHDSRVRYVAGDRSQISTAIGFAGLTAAVAGAAYFYYAHESEKQARSWDARISAGPAPEGGINLAASLVFALPGQRPRPDPE